MVFSPNPSSIILFPTKAFWRSTTLSIGWYITKILLFGPFWLQFGGSYRSFDSFFKVICPWIWLDKKLEWGLKEFKSLPKMSISKKKDLAQFWGFWTALAYSYLVHLPRESTPGFSNVKSLKRRPREGQRSPFKVRLQEKKIVFGCI